MRDCGADCRPAFFSLWRLLPFEDDLLAGVGDPNAGAFHYYARELLASATPPTVGPPWNAFLFWNAASAATGTDYRSTFPLSYLSTGLGAVAMRSGWGQGDTWASFRATAYVDSYDQGEQYYDAGSLAIVRGGMPLLVNVNGFLTTSYAGSPGLDDAYADDDNYVHDAKPVANTFANGGGQTQKFVTESPTPRTGIAFMEDRAGAVYTRGQHLQDTYKDTSDISLWHRDVLFVRPKTVVVYDRTTVTANDDQHMSWNLGLQATATGPRWDVSHAGAFVGSMTPVLPDSLRASSQNPVLMGTTITKVVRVEVRPPAGAAAGPQRWLTVFDTSTAQTAVATARKLSVVSGAVNGTAIEAASGSGDPDLAVAFGAADPPGTAAPPVSFTVRAVTTTKVYVADLAPGSYVVSVSSPAGGPRTVTIANSGTGTSVATSPRGVLAFTVQNGTVQ